MKTETKIIVEPKDVDMVCTILPKNPCQCCSASRDGSCCGCPDGREYANVVNPLRESGIYSYTLKYNKYFQLIEEKEKIQKEMKDIAQELKELFDIDILKVK